MKTARQILEHKQFFREFTLQQLRGRYRGSLLGFLWTLLNPLMILVTFAFVFGYINRADLKTYVPIFFGGYIPWLFFTKVAESAIGSVVYNSQFFTRVGSPRGVFPLSAVAVNLGEFVASVVIGLALLAIFGTHLSPAIAVLPLSSVILLVFVTGIAYLFALVNVFFRDFSFIWANVSFVWFFLTPILYTLDQLPPDARQLIQLNPVLPLITLFQQPIAKGTVPPPETWLLATSLAVVTLIVGTAAYERAQARFYEYL